MNVAVQKSSFTDPVAVDAEVSPEVDVADASDLLVPPLEDISALIIQFKRGTDESRTLLQYSGGWRQQQSQAALEARRRHWA